MAWVTIAELFRSILSVLLWPTAHAPMVMHQPRLLIVDALAVEVLDDLVHRRVRAYVERLPFCNELIQDSSDLCSDLL